jgi:hypothetical protein
VELLDWYEFNAGEMLCRQKHLQSTVILNEQAADIYQGIKKGPQRPFIIIYI